MLFDIVLRRFLHSPHPRPPRYQREDSDTFQHHFAANSNLRETIAQRRGLRAPAESDDEEEEEEKSTSVPKASGGRSASWLGDSCGSGSFFAARSLGHDAFCRMRPTLLQTTSGFFSLHGTRRPCDQNFRRPTEWGLSGDAIVLQQTDEELDLRCGSNR